MSTILFREIVFGPVHSRRLGVSLGVNLLPDDGKVCSFDCIYCECGYNADKRGKNGLPTREAVYNALDDKLKLMVEKGEKPDVITFAGNGEPTLHPQFEEIIEDTIKLINEPNQQEFSVDKLVDNLKRFNGNLIIQTLFLRGEHKGKRIDNTTDKEVDAWLETIKSINPKQVMIYSIDRETPEKNLVKLSKEELEKIALKIRQAGLNVSVSA